MKEAFEKIRKQLEDEELTSADAKAEAIIGMQGVSANYYGGELRAFGRAIQIVSEVEAEYENDVCEWFKYDYRTIAPRCHDAENPYWRIPENMDKLKFCPYCGKKIKVVE